MEKDPVKHHLHPHNNNSGNTTTTTSSTSSSHREKQIIGESLIRAPPSTDFVLKWGSRKRLRCMKIQVKDAAAPVLRTTARVDRRVIRSDANNINAGGSGNYSSNGHLNLRQRAASPAQRILREEKEVTKLLIYHGYKKVHTLTSRGFYKRKGRGVWMLYVLLAGLDALDVVDFTTGDIFSSHWPKGGQICGQVYAPCLAYPPISQTAIALTPGHILFDSVNPTAQNST